MTMHCSNLLLRGLCRLIHKQASRRQFHNAGDETVKYGGLDLPLFQFLCETVPPYIRHTFAPTITSISQGKMTVLLKFRKHFVGNESSPPCLHGGVAASLIDHTAGFCAWSTLDSPFKRVSTVDLRIDYLHPAPCEDLWFDASVAHKSNRMCRVDVDCWVANR